MPATPLSDPVARYLQAVDAVSAHLEQLQEEGVRTMDVLPETVRALSAAVPPTEGVRPMKSTPELEAIARKISTCRLCPLHKTRTRTVPGQGAAHPEILFIGEGPGADEDQQGLAFVGRAGKLLTRMIEAMGLERDAVWIGNIVKCRPPENRAPTAEEMAACLPYLRQQITLLKPRVIVCLGATAVKGLFGTTPGITKIRGHWMTFEDIDTMPTFHPAYLLRNPPAKREVWDDLKTVLKKLNRPVPA